MADVYLLIEQLVILQLCFNQVQKPLVGLKLVLNAKKN